MARAAPVLSVEERDVAGRNIHHMDVEDFQRAQHRLHFRPAVLELPPLFGLPLSPNLVGEVRRRVEPSPSEVEHEGTRDNRHLDDAQSVIARTEEMKTRARAIARFSAPKLSIAADVYCPRPHLIACLQALQVHSPMVAVSLRMTSSGTPPRRRATTRR